MSQPWYHDQRMLAAGNARRRPAGENDLPQPGSARAMPPPPGAPLAGGDLVGPVGPDRGDGTAFTQAFLAEAARVGIDPLDLARLYAKAYARQASIRPHRKPSLIARLFTRKG